MMISLQQIETDLKEALKARNQIAADTLRGLKTRFQNAKIAKQKELSEEDLLALVRSESKKRKEASQEYEKGGRKELAEKELKEAEILSKYLPVQLSEDEIKKAIDAALAENNFTASDFGKAMGVLKSKLGPSADGAVLARLLKEKLRI